MNAHHLLADLESRIAELRDLSNDAYDVAAGTLMPGITDLAPPATPQQEVFGGGGKGGVVDDVTNVAELSPPASWTVREIEEEVEQPVLDGEGNPVLNEDGTTKTETVKRKGWKVWSPIWQSGQTAYMPDGMAEGWNELPVTEGEIYALLRDKTTDSNNMQWANAPVLSIVSGRPNDEAIPYEPVTFSRWVKIGEFKDGQFDQTHTGVIVEDFEATAASSATGIHSDNPLTNKSLSEIDKSSWTVRYHSTYGGMNNVPHTGWVVFAPLWQVGRKLVKYARTLSESAWIPLNVDSGELYAILKVTGEYTGNGYNFDDPGYELSWINEDPSTLSDYQDSDGVKFRWVKIGKFYQDNGRVGFSQFHTGLIIDSTGSSSDVVGQPGKDGVDGEDGATWIPSLRKVTVTTPNTDNSGSTSHEEVYLDFTNSKTEEVIEGTINLKGKDGEKGEPGEPSSGGSGNLPDAQEISFIASIEFKDGKLVATKGTLKVYAAEDVVLDEEPVTLFETTPHSTQHTATSSSGSEA